MIQPSLDEFLRLSERGNLIPVWREVLADTETPVSAYRKLARGTYTFLLESVTGGENIARYSFLGSEPKLVFRSKGRRVEIEGADGRRAFEVDDPLNTVKELLGGYQYVPDPRLPRFCGGFVGYIGYDMVRFFEQLPEQARDDLNLPDMVLMLAEEIVVYDHVDHKIRIVCNTLAEGSERKRKEAYERACERIAKIIGRLHEPLLPQFRPPHGKDAVRVDSTFSKEEFERVVEKGKEYVRAGDVVQVVLSQRLSMRYSADPFDVYRALRSVNPSPFMYYLTLGGLTLVGSSPEVFVRVEGRRAEVRPIAGTRRRGDTPEEDARLAEELLADPKERAEHVMLVDLGRNDLGRVCKYGTVRVPEFMTIERYSHVMHIVSDVVGELRDDVDAFDVIRACFPAGTVSGAPKVRAMEIIEELEPVRRGPYAGAVGYFSFSGDLDSCITIRTLVLCGDTAYVQAGAGVVADSVPENEYFETLNKARAMLSAVELAEKGLEVPTGEGKAVRSAISTVVAGGNLSQEEAYAVMKEIMTGGAAPSQIASFLAALRMKGETVDEITGCALAMREMATKIRCDADVIVDTCGTGGDASGTFNISTVAAFVAAGAGLTVAKHGNRAASSRCGSADVLSALGVNIAVPPKKVEQALAEIGIGFLFAPLLHGAMRYAIGPRREIGIRTIFNILGPLTNPAGATCQVLGVYDGALTETLAGVLGRMGSRHALVVHGDDGLDELTTTTTSIVSEYVDGKVRTFLFDPSDYGIPRAKPEDLAGGDAKENAAIARAILEGEEGPKRDIVVLNAAAAILAGGKAKDFEEAIAAAEESIDSGAALRKLEALVELTNS